MNMIALWETDSGSVCFPILSKWDPEKNKSLLVAYPDIPVFLNRCKTYCISVVAPSEALEFKDQKARFSKVGENNVCLKTRHIDGDTTLSIYPAKEL